MDLRVLPALVPERFRNESSRAVEVELTTRISKLKEKIDAGLFEQDSAEADDSPKTKCSFQLFAQLEQTNVPKDLMDELESEIDEPTGITTVNAPELVFDGVLLSQNCSILYEIKHTVGVQYVNSCLIGKTYLTTRLDPRGCIGRSRRVCTSYALLALSSMFPSRLWCCDRGQPSSPWALPQAGSAE